MSTAATLFSGIGGDALGLERAGFRILWRRIAEYLYGEREWTMTRIAEALNVSKSTVANDLRDFPIVGKSPQSKGKGRPRKVTPEIEQQIVELYFEHGPRSRPKIADALGIGQHAVQLAVEREKARREIAGTIPSFFMAAWRPAHLLGLRRRMPTHALRRSSRG